MCFRKLKLFATAGLLLMASMGSAQIVENLEYFFDTDPGYGLGAPISITPDSSITTTDVFPTTTLSTGFHILYLRALASGLLTVSVPSGSLDVDTLSIWGIPEGRLVYLDISGGLTTVTNLEYFFDTDPGYGSGIGTTTFSANQNVLLDDQIDGLGLSTGFHTLYIRAQLTGGTWGIPEQRLVYVDQSGATINTVTALEYFFDVDPGYGNGISTTTFSASQDVLLNDQVDGTGLSLGFHTLYFRAQLTGGAWGMPEQRLVYVDQSGATVNTVIALEYFFDDDPGYGNGISTTLFNASQNVLVDDQIDGSGLSQGFHTLFIRAQLTGGVWGMPEQRLVYVDQSGVTLNTVTALEYFFDEDPGYGNGTAMTAFSGSQNLTLDDSISTTNLSFGFHTVYIRGQLSGGEWGIPEQRLVYVDQSDATVALVSSMEYFFDNDPGYGNGIPVSAFSSSMDVTVNELIATTALSTGFHSLFIRAQLQGGVWGIPERRQVYADVAGTIHQVAALEYFFDTDPGYGQANQVAIQNADSILIKVFLAASQLSEGAHKVFIRPQSQTGEWGLPESAIYYQYSPSRQLDSASLVALYKETGGSSWTTKTSWTTGILDNWYGVTVTNGRVTGLALPNNNLFGELPRPVGYISELTALNLSSNGLLDTIPASMLDLQKLITLNLHDNDFDEIPDISGIATLSTLSLDSNYFDFSDLEPLVGVSNFTYQNQRPFQDSPEDSVVSIGQDYLFSKTIKGTNNQYQWYLGNSPVSLGDYEDLEIINFNSADTGHYVLRVTNPTVPGLEISTFPTLLRISDFEEDSLALVSFYQSTGGNQWNINTNWLSGSLSSWSGVTVSNGRATSLSMPSNNLAGKIPANLSFADALMTMDLSGNQLLDTIPNSIVKIGALQTLNLSSNRISSIPSFSSNVNLNSLDVSGNKLQFGDLEQNIGIQTFMYSPQDSISVMTDTLVDTNTNYLLGFPITGANNTYQWLLNGSPISGATQKQLNIQNIQFANEGQYLLKVTNAQLPNLTLYSGTFSLRVSSLSRDSIALRKLYDDTNGPSWSTQVNWETAKITSWNNITLGSNRVTGITLNNQGLTGIVPSRIRDITSLQSADFSGNNLTSIPKLSVMPQLSTLNISNNRIGFAEIQANLGITNFTYSPQKTFTSDQFLKIPQGSSYPMSIDVSGSGNQYKWYLGTNQIANQTKSNFTVQSIAYDSMGVYHAEVSNPQVTGLTIKSGVTELLATANLSGLIRDPSNTLTGAAKVIVYETGAGPYDSISTASVATDGTYQFDQLVLSDYLIKAIPNDKTQFVTYYGNTILWTEADIIQLRESDGMSYDVKIAGSIQEETGEEYVKGLVELEVPDDGRIMARRKVTRAGCSMRRIKGSGRNPLEEYDLEFYIETDDEGRFSFAGLPNGTYRLNIDYPGVAMDENSFVLIEITGDMVLELLAVITENGISVEQTNALGIHRPFISGVTVYPNPAVTVTQLDYQVKKQVDGISLKIWSVSGQLILTQEIPSSIGRQSVELDVSRLERGLYFLILESANQEFIVQYRLLLN